MKNEINKAKNILLSCFAIILVFDIFFISISQTFSGVIRLLITVALMYFIYLGHTWAKWTFSALALIASFYSVIVTIKLFYVDNSLLCILMGVFGIFWFFFGMYLVKSKNLQKFFCLQKLNGLSGEETGHVSE